MSDLTWTCHVCGEDRPDAMISVFSRTVMIGKIEAQENVRYCNDRPACVEGAVFVALCEIARQWIYDAAQQEQGRGNES